MPPLSPIGYSVKTWSLSPYPTRFGQVEREPEPMLRIPSQWHCLMEVTARPGFHLFKTDPGYNDRVRPATETSRRRRAPSAGVRSSLDSPLEGSGFEPSVPGDKPWVPSWKMVRVLQVPAGQAIPQYDAAGMLGSALS